MAQNTRSIEATMEQLDQVAESLRGAMASMGQKNADMNQVTDLTISLAHQLAAIGKDLEARISHFKTTCEQKGGEIATGGICEESDKSEQSVQAMSKTDKLVAGNIEASATLLEI